jgi:hypothetical protein
MDPTSRTFLRAVRQRLLAAEFLRENDYNLDALYLAGYCIECGFKALILDRTPRSRRAEVLDLITRGAACHNYEVLADHLKQAGSSVPPGLLRRCIKSAWSTDLRYEVGRIETWRARAFLELAEALIAWVERSLSP